MSSSPNSNYLTSPTVSRRRGSSHKRSMSADFDAVGLGLALGFGNSPRSQQQQNQQNQLQLQFAPQTPPRQPSLFAMQEDLDKDFSFPNFKDPVTTPPPPPPPPFKFNQFHRPSKSLNSPIRFQRTDNSIKEIDEENDDDDNGDGDGDDDDEDDDLVDDDASSYSFFGTPRSAANANRYHRIISNVNGVERVITPPTTLTTPEIIVTNDGNGTGHKDLYRVASSDSSMGEKIKQDVGNNYSTSSLSKEISMSPRKSNSVSPPSIPMILNDTPKLPCPIAPTINIPPLRSSTSTPTPTSIPTSTSTSTPTPVSISIPTQPPVPQVTVTVTTPPLRSSTTTPPLRSATTSPPLRSSTTTPPLKSTTDLISSRRQESPAEKKILKETKIPAFRKTKTLAHPSSTSSLSTSRTIATTSTDTPSINTAATTSPYHLSRHEFKHRGFLQRRGSNSTDTSSISSIRLKLKRSSRIFDWLKKNEQKL